MRWNTQEEASNGAISRHTSFLVSSLCVCCWQITASICLYVLQRDCAFELSLLVTFRFSNNAKASEIQTVIAGCPCLIEDLSSHSLPVCHSELMERKEYRKKERSQPWPRFGRSYRKAARPESCLRTGGCTWAGHPLAPGSKGAWWTQWQRCVRALWRGQTHAPPLRKGPFHENLRRTDRITENC